MVASPQDVSGGLISMTRTRLIMGLTTHIVIYLTVTKPVREAKARLWAVAPLMMMMMMITYAISFSSEVHRVSQSIQQGITAVLVIIFFFCACGPHSC
jgi:hypothetical protein